MIRPQYTIVEAPSVLGLFPGGVERLPDALLSAGLAERLGARRAGRVQPPPYDSKRDPDTLLLNPRGIADYTRALADALGSALDAGEVPVVLGGDCSIVLGCVLAMRRRRRSGLLFIDGHADFYQPEAEPRGEAASMDLALATGRGPRIVTDPEGLWPLVRDEDVVLFARRDAADARKHGSQRVEDTDIEVIDLDAVRAEGARNAVARALDMLAEPALDGFWLHLDADALDDAAMPAVDYRMPGGLSFDELADTLSVAAASGRLRGLDITIYNPALDPGGVVAAAFVDTLVRGLRQ